MSQGPSWWSNCEGKGVLLVWGKPSPYLGEGGPTNAGRGQPNPEPAAEYMDIPANPVVAKDMRHLRSAAVRTAAGRDNPGRGDRYHRLPAERRHGPGLRVDAVHRKPDHARPEC